MRRSTPYIIGFAAAICLVCSVFVSSAAVSLKEKQDYNKVLDRQKKVLGVAGLIEESNAPPATEIQSMFETKIQAKIVTLKTGDYAKDVDAKTFDQRKMRNDPANSISAPAGNKAKVQRLPNDGIVYQLVENDKLKLLILPIEGKGLWSTLYGFLAIDPDLNTIKGITFYEHAETPGLGGEIDNPGWKAKWPGRKIYGKDGSIKIQVIKGQAGTVAEDPHRVDGLSGATLTARGVSELVKFWLGDHGWGPYLKKMKKGA